RLANDIAGADDDRIASSHLNTFMLQKTHDAIGRARREDRIADHQATDIVKVEPVDILLRIDGAQNPFNIELFWQGQLYQTSVHTRIYTQVLDRIGSSLLSAVFGKQVLR